MWVACIQWRADVTDYLTPTRFAARVDRLLGEARALAGPGPLLAVFPEDVGTPAVLYQLLPDVDPRWSFRQAMELAVRSHSWALLRRRLRHHVSWTRALFLLQAQRMVQLYVMAFAAAARRHQAWVVAGSILLPAWADPGPPPPPAAGSGKRRLWRRPRPADPPSCVYNTAYLFDPEGQIVGRQRKCYLIELEGPQGLDICPGQLDGLAVYETPFGRLGIAICLDAFQDEVVDRLAELGADLLVQPSANPSPWTPQQQEDWLRGAARALLRRPQLRCALNPMMVGYLFDLEFAGQSAIFSRDPLPAVRGIAGRGGYRDVGSPLVAAVAETDADEDVVVARLPGAPA